MNFLIFLRETIKNVPRGTYHYNSANSKLFIIIYKNTISSACGGGYRDKI